MQGVNQGGVGPCNPALGPTQSQKSKALAAQILCGVGQWDEALPIARASAEALQIDPAFGAAHPETPAI